MESNFKRMILVTDGGPEFKNIKGTINDIVVTPHLSTGINKAVLAEVSIRKARAILRKVETLLNIDNIINNSKNMINESNMSFIFDQIQETIHKKAGIRQPKPIESYKPSKFKLGDPPCNAEIL
jgi:hypothetical protein